MTLNVRKCVNCGVPWDGWGLECNECKRLNVLKETAAQQERVAKDQAADAKRAQDDARRAQDDAHEQAVAVASMAAETLRLARVAEWARINPRGKPFNYETLAHTGAFGGYIKASDRSEVPADNLSQPPLFAKARKEPLFNDHAVRPSNLDAHSSVTPNGSAASIKSESDYLAFVSRVKPELKAYQAKHPNRKITLFDMLVETGDISMAFVVQSIEFNNSINKLMKGGYWDEAEKLKSMFNPKLLGLTTQQIEKKREAEKEKDKKEKSFAAKESAVVSIAITIFMFFLLFEIGFLGLMWCVFIGFWTGTCSMMFPAWIVG